MKIADPHSLEIVTEDGVGFSVRLASPVVRALALGMDLLAIYIIQSVIQIALSLLVVLSIDVAVALIVLGNFVIGLGYFILSEIRLNGQTFGKRMLRLRVMDARSRRLTPGQVVIRTLFRTLDMFPLLYFTGGVVSLLNPRFQRLGDLAAGTLVIRIPTAPPPLPQEIRERKYNSLRQNPEVESQLQRLCTPEDVEVLIEALNRRETLEADSRVAVFHDLADHFRTRIRFPSGITESLSDEALLLNILDSLTRNQRELG